MTFRFCVCPAWAFGIRRYQIIPEGKTEGQVPYVQESPYRVRGWLCPEALASHKGDGSDPISEGSETANPGSNEQEPDSEAGQVG